MIARKLYILFLLPSLSYLFFAIPSFAEIGNIERQDQIIRNQHQEEEQEKRQREFDLSTIERAEL
mgnify:CR=1 FL=1